MLTCVVGVAAAPILVLAMASGLKQDPRVLSWVFMTRWMFPAHRFHVTGGAGSGVLNTWRRFAVPLPRRFCSIWR
jgi:putative peptidoglycan lipid II flippase